MKKEEYLKNFLCRPKMERLQGGISSAITFRCRRTMAGSKLSLHCKIRQSML